ncbi:peptidylprolyl isomerase [Chloroflexota bacterium]
MATDGDIVQVHYTGTLADGSVFDSSQSKDPLQFTIGEASVIPGFENAVRGLSVGDSVTVTLPADEAYGPVREDMQMVVEKSLMPPDINPVVDDSLIMQQSNGAQVQVKVIAVSDNTVTIDANHPLAGQPLTFEIELVNIKR